MNEVFHLLFGKTWKCVWNVRNVRVYFTFCISHFLVNNVIHYSVVQKVQRVVLLFYSDFCFLVPGRTIYNISCGEVEVLLMLILCSFHTNICSVSIFDEMHLPNRQLSFTFTFINFRCNDITCKTKISNFACVIISY